MDLSDILFLWVNLLRSFYERQFPYLLRVVFFRLFFTSSSLLYNYLKYSKMDRRLTTHYHDPKNFEDQKHLIIHSPTFNKGTAFTANERSVFKLRGLIPSKIETLEQQLKRVETQVCFL